MDESDINSDLLSRIRSALDGGLSTIGSNNRVETEIAAPEASMQAQEKYIDIDDYCKLIQDSAKIDSSMDSPSVWDSRSLLPADQVKSDSQQTPFSVVDFQNRVASFDIMKWSQKPDIISGYVCARYGWKLTEWGSLACVTCKKFLPVPSQMFKFNGTDWAVRLRKSMEKTAHLSTCPWTKIPSPEDILSIPKGPDLYTYICDAAASFKQMRSLPVLEDHYKLIMATLNLKWMRELLCLEHPKDNKDEGRVSDESSTMTDTHQDMTLFLTLNGWTMAGTNSDDDVIKCTLCLREVPLWLCKYTPVENEILDLLSAPPSPIKNKDITKELEPVKNHWEWCPWRKTLQYMPLAVCIDNSLDDNSETNLLCSSKLKDTVDVYDYERLLEAVQEECANIKLDYHKEKSGVHLLDSVSSMMKIFMASPPTQTSSASNRDYNETTPIPTTAVSVHVDDEETLVPLQNNKRPNTDTEIELEGQSKKRLCRDIFATPLNGSSNN